MHRLVASDPPPEPKITTKLNAADREAVSSWHDKKLQTAVIGLIMSIISTTGAVIAMRKPSLDAYDQLVQIQSTVKDLSSKVDTLTTKQGDLATVIHDQSQKLGLQIEGEQKDLNAAERDLQELHLRITMLERRH